MGEDGRTAQPIDAGVAAHARVLVDEQRRALFGVDVDARRFEDDGAHPVARIDGRDRVFHRLYRGVLVEGTYDCAGHVQRLEHARYGQRRAVRGAVARFVAALRSLAVRRSAVGPITAGLVARHLHEGASRAGVRLLAGHGRRRVVEHAQDELVAVVDGVHDTRDAACEKGRVAHEAEGQGLGVGAGDALGHGEAGAHAHAGVDHLERRGVAQRVAADVAAEGRFALSHCPLHGQKARAVRAPRAQHRRTCGQLGFRHGAVCRFAVRITDGSFALRACAFIRIVVSGEGGSRIF